MKLQELNLVKLDVECSCAVFCALPHWLMGIIIETLTYWLFISESGSSH